MDELGDSDSADEDIFVAREELERRRSKEAKLYVHSLLPLAFPCFSLSLHLTSFSLFSSWSLWLIHFSDYKQMVFMLEVL